MFLAWGTPAQKRIDSIGVDKNKHCVLKSVHPSPLSAARGFFDCKHFTKANEWLRQRYGVEGEVEWDCLADEKRNRGLPSNPDATNKQIDNSGILVCQTDIREKNSAGNAASETKSAFDDGENDATTEDAHEFDDEQLDKMLSSQPDI